MRTFTVVSTNALDAGGYRVTYGNSYIQAVTWQPDGKGYTPDVAAQTVETLQLKE